MNAFTPDRHQTALRRLLDEGAAHGPEYGQGLSNHLPMALSALERLGADGPRLREFADAYVHDKAAPAAPPPTPWPDGQAWTARLDDIAAWPAYRTLFRDQIAHDGPAGVLARHVPLLMRGCGAVAFHGLIRAAHAVQAAHDAELADALAYWACRWMDLGESASGGTAADPGEVLEPLAIASIDAPLIALRMQAAARDPAFEAVVSVLRIDDTTLPRIARLAARLYARSGNFTVLHLVTSALAVRVLLPFLPDPRAGVAAYWRAVVAGVVASRLDLSALGAAPNPMPWSELAAAAVRSSDEHVIKLVDAGQLEQQAYGGAPDWQQACTLAVLRDDR